jgi:hypothetical protein
MAESFVDAEIQNVISYELLLWSFYSLSFGTNLASFDCSVGVHSAQIRLTY